jgi:tetratricopeptide (TPR) repeat protein
MKIVLFIYLLSFSILSFGQDTLSFFNKFNITDDDFWKRERSAYYLNSTQILNEDKLGFYNRGIENLRNGFYIEAINDFKRSISDRQALDLNWMDLSDNSKIYPWYYIGICKTELGEMDSALIYFKKSLEKDALFFGSYAEIGNLYSSSLEFKKAHLNYDKALELSPDAWFIYINKTLAYMQEGQFKEAKKLIKQATEKFPEKEALFMLKGALHRYKGSTSSAYKAYSSAINLNQESFLAYYYRSVLRIKKGKFLDAKDDILRARQIDSSHYQSLYILGYINMRLDNPKLGINQIAQSILQQRLEDPYYYAFSYSTLEFDDLILKISDGKLSKAEKQIGIDFFTDYFNYFNSLVSALQGQQKYTEDYPNSIFVQRINLLYYSIWYNINSKRGSINSISDGFMQDRINNYLKNLINQDSNLVFPLVLCSEYYYLKHDYNIALVLINKAIEIQTDYTYAYNLRGLLYENLKEEIKSFRDFNYTIELCPLYGMAYYNRGRWYFNKGDYNKSLNDLRNSVRLYPGNDDSYYYLGKCYFQFGKLDSAIICFDEAIKINRMHADAYNGRANIHMNKGEYEKAEADYTSAIFYDDRNTEYYLNRAELFIQTNKYEAARFDLREAKNITPQNVKIYELFGRLFYLKGKYEDCIENSKIAIYIDENNFKSMYNIALANLCLGNIEESEKLYKNYTELNIEKTGKIPIEAKKNLMELALNEKYREIANNILKRYFKIMEVSGNSSYSNSTY